MSPAGSRHARIDGDEAAVGHLLATEQRSDHLDALEEASIADVLVGPPVPGHVLVEGLTRSEDRPEAAGEEVGERGDRLGDDRRVVALPGAVTTPNGTEVACIAAPSHDQAWPEWPCRSLQGARGVRGGDPLEAGGLAAIAASSSADGDDCSCEAWNATVDTWCRYPRTWVANWCPRGRLTWIRGSGSWRGPAGSTRSRSARSRDRRRIPGPRGR